MHRGLERVTEGGMEALGGRKRGKEWNSGQSGLEGETSLQHLGSILIPSSAAQYYMISLVQIQVVPLKWLGIQISPYSELHSIDLLNRTGCGAGWKGMVMIMVGQPASELEGSSPENVNKEAWKHVTNWSFAEKDWIQIK